MSNAVEGTRKVIQDLIAPDLKAIDVRLAALEKLIDVRFSAVDAKLAAAEQMVAVRFASAEQLAASRHEQIISILNMEKRLTVVEEVTRRPA